MFMNLGKHFTVYKKKSSQFYLKKKVISLRRVQE